MSIFKCKMCGGSLEVPEGASSCTCDYCGTRQTVATVRDENLQGLFNRANVLRMKSEFDKAADIYERILQADETEAEAYWGLILCKYGIEYVEDPKTYQRIPTCHRASYDAVTADEDYKNAIRYADTTQRAIYEREAAAIDEIQKGIVLLAQKEDPYDVFICYKETDESGKRTQDSVIANDIYYQLTREGFKVFYAAITLESKLGSEYEPYIFSALNSAKVMLTIGTKPEYFNAVWVRNEWSRFLKLLKKDRSRLLIPCYKDMDPYELPEEFAHLQAQDMGKIGFINDLVRGIKKVLDAGKEPTKETVVQQTIVQQTAGYSSNVVALLKRGTMALEDMEWEKADGFFEDVLNQDAECSEAYVGKILAQQKAVTLELLAEKLVAGYAQAKEETLEACPGDNSHIAEIVKACTVENYLDADQIEKLYQGFDRRYVSSLSCRKKQKQELEDMLSRDRTLTRALKYAKGEQKQKLDAFMAAIADKMDVRIAEAEKKDAAIIADIKQKYAAFLKSMDDKAYQLKEEAETKRLADYEKHLAVLDGNSIDKLKDARDWFYLNSGYRNCAELEIQARKKRNRLMAEKEADAQAAAKKKKRITAILAAVVVAVIAIAVVYAAAIKPALNYKKAVAFMQAEQYEEAIAGFEALGNFKDSPQQVENCKNAIKERKYNDAVSFMQSEQYEEAIAGFEALEDYKDSPKLIEVMEQTIKERNYLQALSLTAEGDYAGAVSIFATLKGYKDVDSLMVNDQNLAREAKFSVGKYVTFGTYPQTNAGNDETEIEWMVLARDGNRALLISCYGLYSMQYNKEWADTTYENSIVRQWLNKDFIAKAFTQKEQGAIVTTCVTADENPRYSTNPGNSTEDKVFLLSIQEVEKYCANYEARKCQPTSYAIMNGGANSFWWLRSPGYNSGHIAGADFNGEVHLDGFRVDRHLCVRPAIWIDLDSDFFATGISSSEQKFDEERIIDEMLATESLEEVEAAFAIGNYVKFGSYPQTKEGNDRTEIEWLVLAREGQKALLISRYALDKIPFNEKDAAITYEQSTIRQWMNNDFMDKAFTLAEQKAIFTTELEEERSNNYSTNHSGVIADKIFLLSIQEAYQYFTTAEDRKCVPSDYAIADKSFCWWWLRSPAYNRSHNSSRVSSDGTVDRAGCGVGYTNGCVRPAMWVNLDSDFYVSGKWQAEYNNEKTAPKKIGYNFESGVFLPDEKDNGKLETKFAVGNYVTFGSYPQTKEGNDRTEIEWLVLAREGQKALLISRYGLDAASYNEKRENVTYEESTIRQWLNTDFVNKAFTLEEQGKIVFVKVPAD